MKIDTTQLNRSIDEAFEAIKVKVKLFCQDREKRADRACEFSISVGMEHSAIIVQVKKMGARSKAEDPICFTDDLR